MVVSLYHIANVIIGLLSLPSKSLQPTMSKSSSLTKRPSKAEKRASDIVSLHKEREENKFPLTKPPFLRTDTWPAAEKEVSPMYFALSQSNSSAPSRSKK